MRFGCCAILALTACYAPQVVGGAPCDPSRDSCPTGQTCQPLGSGNYCTTGGMRGGDAGADSAPISSDGGTCLGRGVLGSVCLSGAAPAPVSLTTVTINTVSTTAGNCQEIRAQASGPSLCLITGTTISVAAGATVRGVGANPLVLVATQSITIDGTIDVSTHSNETIGGVPALGGGARNATSCFAAGVDGQGGSGSNGGGGAAGGSFGGLGAIGGTGANNGSTAHGTPASPGAPTVLVGGCPGGHGGDGSGGGPGGANAGGAGGNAGGAVYLLAGDSITIGGKINASGAGGGGGANAVSSSGGGGGGGAGGMIGLEAARITVTGAVFANGGGGGAGGGNAGTGDAGRAGTDPTAATTAAAGGTGPNNGGNGGAGSVGSTAPVVGKNGSGSFPQCGGGGGGGGAGVIRVFGVSPASIGGQVSPPAS